MVFRGQNELVFAFGVMARLAAAQNVAVGDFVRCVVQCTYSMQK